MADDRFLLVPVSLAESARAALPDAEEWADDRHVLRWAGKQTTVEVTPDRVMVLSGPRAAADLITGWGKPGFLRELDEYAAGAVIDRPTGEVAAFRDVVGGRSAYVAAHDDGLIASNLVETIRDLRLPFRPDPTWIASILQNQNLDAAHTPLEGVEDVLPGHIVTRSGQGLVRRQAADWRSVRVPRRETQAVERFADLLKAGIRRQLAGAERAGVMLSGGQDSTLLMALAKEAAPDVDWRAYCIPFTESRGDERNRQQAVADHVGVPITWVSVEGRGPYGSQRGLFDGLAGPPMIGNWFFGAAVAEQADADHVDVVFDGEDADSLLYGDLNYIADLLARGRLLKARREVARWEPILGITARTLLRDAVHSVAPPWLRPTLGDDGPDVTVSPLIGPELAATVDVRTAALQPHLMKWRIGRQFSVARRQTVKPDGLGTVIRETAAAWRNSAARLEHPYADRQVIEFCLALRWHLLVGDRPKNLIRRASEGRLPDWFLNSPSKANLSEYWDAAVLGHDRERAHQGMRAASSADGLTDRSAVEALIRAWEGGTETWMAGRVGGLGLWLTAMDSNFEKR